MDQVICLFIVEQIFCAVFIVPSHFPMSDEMTKVHFSFKLIEPSKKEDGFRKEVGYRVLEQT